MIEPTECGLAAYRDKRVLAYLLNVATTQLERHKLPVDRLEEGLRLDVASYLLAVPCKGRLGFRPAFFEDITAEFIAEQRPVRIDSIVKDLVARARGACKDMGL